MFRRPCEKVARLEAYEQGSSCSIMVWIGRQRKYELILKNELVKNVLEVKRVSDRVMSLKL